MISKLDGKTSSREGWTGPIGKLLGSVNDMERNYSFSPISGLVELIHIPQDIVTKMSADSSLFYQLGVAIRSGVLTRELGSKKVGNLSHARWINTGTALMILWVSKHGLSTELENRLEVLVTFVIQVFHTMFFQIKVLHSLDQGPRHILLQQQLIQKQPKMVQDIVQPYSQSGAWFAHSEPVLLSLLCSSEREERIFAVAKILEIIGTNTLGDTKVWPRKTPLIRQDAVSLIILINWDNNVFEPIFTCHLTNKEVRKLVDVPLPIPPYSVHTQSIERVIQEVTHASEKVAGFQARDGFVRARMESRAALPKFTTKQDMLALFTD